MSEEILLSAFGGVLVLFLSVIMKIGYDNKKVGTTTLIEVRLINGRLGKLEERVSGHKELSDGQQAETGRRLEQLEQRDHSRRS